MVRCTGIRDAPSRPREVQVTRDCREVRKAFPEKTPVFLWVSQATTPYFSQKTQKFYLFVKDPQVKTVHLCCRPPRGGAWIEVQGVQQVAVFVCAVLRAHGDQAVGFLGVDAEVFHQGRRCPGALADIVVEHVPQVEAGGGCPLQSFAGQVAGLLRCSQTVSHVGEVIAEPLGVDVLDAFTERVQLVASRPGCCRELIDGRVVLVAEVGQILPGLHDRLACCDCDAAHSAADGHGLPVDVFQLAGDIVQRLAE